MRLHPGEVEAGSWQVELLDSVLRRLCEMPPEVQGRPRVVAVDGRGGAGKTVLVERLQKAVPAGCGARRRHRLDPCVLRLGRGNSRERAASPVAG